MTEFLEEKHAGVQNQDLAFSTAAATKTLSSSSNSKAQMSPQHNVRVELMLKMK